MKLNLKINGKMLLYILGTTIVVYVSALSYAAIQLRSNSYKNAQEILEAKTVEISNEANKRLNSYFRQVDVLAKTFSNYQELPELKRRALLTETLDNFLNENPEYSSVWSIWEPMTIDQLDEEPIDNDGSRTLGNFIYKCYRTGELNNQSISADSDADAIYNSEEYTQVKQVETPIITEPIFLNYGNKGQEEILVCKIVIPIVIDGTFLGVVGADVPMDYLQQAFSKIKPMDAGKTYIITYGGEFLAHPDPDYLGKYFDDYAPELNEINSIQQFILEGISTEFEGKEPLSGEISIFKFKPLNIGTTETPWSLCVSVPLDVFYQRANRTFSFAALIGLIGMVIISLVIFGIAKTITNPIKKTTHVLEEISRGNIRNVEMIKFVFNDEINDMAIGMNKVVEGLNSAAMFAQQIGEGYLNVDYKLLSERDALGLSLISMQKSLIIAKKAEEEKRIEDEKRNWVTHGLAKFGEIIRQHNEDMNKFTLNIAKNIVDYMGIAQVALYINQQIENENSDNDIFELKAAIAYGKPVMLNKTFEKGRELLGRVASENKTIYLENLPERYVILSPGMKEKRRPTNLLISSLHINDNTLGVIELLSYDKLEAHHIDFIEKLCENIASVVASVKTNLRTEKLLQQSQHQADELAQHEEEMRQNLEEMEATQEEANKRQNELKSYLKAIKSSVMSAELDMQGRILDISPSMSAVYGATIENMRGKYYENFVAQDKNSQDEFTVFWDNMTKSGTGKRKQKINQRNKEIWLLESYLLIKKDGLPPKVLVVAIDKTEEKLVIDKLSAALKAHNMS